MKTKAPLMLFKIYHTVPGLSLIGRITLILIVNAYVLGDHKQGKTYKT